MILKVKCPECGYDDHWVGIVVPEGIAPDDVPSNTEYHCGVCGGVWTVFELHFELR